MKVTNNQQDTAFKENVLVRFPKKIKPFNLIRQMQAKEAAVGTGRISETDLFVLLKGDRTVLVSDISTALGQKLRQAHDYGRRIADVVFPEIQKTSKTKRREIAKAIEQPFNDILAEIMKDKNTVKANFKGN